MATKKWEPTGNWDNHRVLLKKAIDSTKGTIWEFGCGEGSTPLLRSLKKRLVNSFETDINYCRKYNANHVVDWDDVHKWGIGEGKEVDVVLVDHTPGERRWEDVKLLKDKNVILVLHDSEPPPCGGNYGYHNIWDDFKYRVDFPSDGAWTTAVSNVYDVTQWIGGNIKPFRNA